MFNKILIANRGEIACRIIKTARRMGIETVAVFSQADTHARHVRMADEAICIGPAQARESYLAIDRIIDAANQAGAQAIHPGYGFLSESAAFSEACEKNHIVFIGPPAAAIKAMGSKSAAKTLMESVGVPMTPGYHGENQQGRFLKEQAHKIGYPVLIKASAGGGGKGMRRVDQPEDFEAALVACQRESLSAFGDDQVLIEKFVIKPRHIEIQVFADGQGQCVHLFERDCSVQRRHQKVLEEAPAPGMTAQRRAAMGKAAVEAALAVGYVGAGTVEFIVDQDGRFYFMEMNTRLQVEHPVTEMVTGVDLVEWQLRIAHGEALPLRQEQLGIEGHAIEARIYAEDPGKDFLPATGRLYFIQEPSASKNVRIDSGVEQGDEITPYYDPMIAKLIVWGSDRHAALRQMRRALAQFRIVGVTNNIEFLSRLVTCPAFEEADLDTALIEREANCLFPEPTQPCVQVWALAVLAQLLHEQSATDRYQAEDRDSPWHRRDGWLLNSSSHRTMVLRHGECTLHIGIASQGGGWRLSIGNETVEVEGHYRENGKLEALIEDRRVSTDVVMASGQIHVFLGGLSFPVLVVQADDHGMPTPDDTGGLSSPMPGKIIALLAQVGESLERGAPLLVLEAMKMEHTINAPSEGKVTAFNYGIGDQVSEGDLLVVFEALEKPAPPNVAVAIGA